MKSVVKFTAVIALLFSCMSDPVGRTKPVIISKGYIFGEQAGSSSLSYYDLKKDSLTKNVFASNNNGSTLDSYLQHLSTDGELIFATLQGGYGTGTGRKIIAMNKNLKQIGETNLGPEDFNPKYVYPLNGNLYVSYSKGKTHKMQKFTYSHSNELVSFSMGDTYDFLINDYNAGRLVFLDGKIMSHGANLIELFDATTLQRVDTIRTTDKLIYSVVFNHKFYVSSMTLNEANTEGDQTLKASGFYVINPNAEIEDTINTDYGVDRMVVSESKMYAAKWTFDSKNSSSWPTTYKNLKTYIVEFNPSLAATELFESSKLQGLNSSYLNFSYDPNERRFIIPNGKFVGNDISTDITDKSGNVLKTLKHDGQVIPAVILSEKQ